MPLAQELESVRSKRAGRKGAEDVDPAWINVEGLNGPKKVASSWEIGDLYAYQVWAELSKEMFEEHELDVKLS